MLFTKASLFHLLGQYCVSITTLNYFHTNDFVLSYDSYGLVVLVSKIDSECLVNITIE